MILFGAIFACLLVWAYVFSEWRAGRAVVAYEPRRAVPWSLLDVVAIVVLYLGLSLVVTLLLVSRIAPDRSAAPTAPTPAAGQQATDPQEAAARIWASSIANVMAVAAAIAILYLHSGARWPDLGWTWRADGRDLKLATAAFVAVGVPIYGIQAVLNLWFKEQHPIVEAVTKDPRLLLPATVAAVLVAPFAEELLFRVILQGWLEKVWRGSDIARDDPPTQPQANGTADNTMAEEEAIETGAGRQQAEAADRRHAAAADENPYIAPRHGRHVDGPGQPVPVGRDTPLKPGPIVISSLIFAGAHLGHGGAPIPLFFLALALGYLYQRTHRIWASMAVHLFLNGCSMVMLWIEVFNPN